MTGLQVFVFILKVAVRLTARQLATSGEEDSSQRPFGSQVWSSQPLDCAVVGTAASSAAGEEVGVVPPRRRSPTKGRVRR